MAALGILLRRAGMCPYPATEDKPELDESLVLCNGIKSDGASYVIVPNFTFKRDDTIIINYSGYDVSTMQLVFGARTSEKGVFWGIEINQRSYFGEFSKSGTEIYAQNIAGFNQPNTIFKTDVGYSSSAGGVRRRFYINDIGQKGTMPGDVDETLTHNLFVLTSNVAGTQDTDSRYFQGVMHSFKVISYAGEDKLSLLPSTKNGIPGMYDEVSKAFYSNAGGGKLIVL